MKVPETIRQPDDSLQEPFTMSLALSAAMHAVLIVGMIGSAWWVGTPAYHKPTAYTVSLVDAPLTLHAPSPSPRRQAASETGIREARTALRKPKPPAQVAKTHNKPPALLPARRQASRRTRPQRSKPTATAMEARQAVRRLRHRQTRKVQMASRTQQQAVEQRLAALRARFGKDMAEKAMAEASSGVQQVRLRAYQELVREQIIDAWILPLPHDEARTLQATALLKVGRDGHIAQLELLNTSGNPLFDDSLIQAVKRAAPLPPLPEDYPGKFLEVEMRFRPGDR